MGMSAERRAARDRVDAYHHEWLTELLEHVGAALDRHRAQDLDIYAVDAVIHQYHRAAQELWKFCWAGGGGTHFELVADVIQRQTDAEATTDWWIRGEPRRRRE
jgi:hypothetical protein